jgi:hypothetical protein
MTQAASVLSGPLYPGKPMFAASAPPGPQRMAIPRARVRRARPCCATSSALHARDLVAGARPCRATSSVRSLGTPAPGATHVRSECSSGTHAHGDSPRCATSSACPQGPLDTWMQHDLVCYLSQSKRDRTLERIVRQGRISDSRRSRTGPIMMMMPFNCSYRNKNEPMSGCTPPCALCTRVKPLLCGSRAS